MSVIVEMNADAIGDQRVMRVTMSRVPSVGEIIRVLLTVNDATTASRFRVLRATHNANSDAYPRRANELDAWVDCVAHTYEGPTS